MVIDVDAVLQFVTFLAVTTNMGSNRTARLELEGLDAKEDGRLKKYLDAILRSSSAVDEVRDAS